MKIFSVALDSCLPKYPSVIWDRVHFALANIASILIQCYDLEAPYVYTFTLVLLINSK